jgi:hypothetical protein
MRDGLAVWAGRLVRTLDFDHKQAVADLEHVESKA